MALVIVFCICYNICLVFKCVKELHLVMLDETTGNFDKFVCMKIPENNKSIFNTKWNNQWQILYLECRVGNEKKNSVKKILIIIFNFNV